ncbi:hypothetical protein CAPTEDRAFT_205863 [Capitella teleta]|uniref:EF-hand domain-containing protein n=1 Tax=Capitella teleta TaxID=283909 RepID=R7TJP5_CAPTE|nr:hypothetical protein CAPTEDRAFT_205863 [Capitella teleta]|eukprot:ELT93929.1 hypothetical protein CAPTEDRAFT_205863 [Capitella teleta]
MSGNMNVSSEGISNGLSNRTSMPKTPPNSGTEGLTPMPDYMKPVCKSASHRYRKLHEDLMMSKLLDRRKVKKQHNQEMRDQVRKQARKIPIEILTKSWLTEDASTVETRAFLVDKIFPTVILGMEKLLLEAEKKELANSNEVDSTFNPVNFLAQYLMRNNPKYSNFSEASPYVRGLRQVGEELREQLFDIEENKLARIKAEARKKKEEREKVERLRIMEVDRRYRALVEQFKDWHIGRLHEAKVDLALLQNTIRSFAEIAEQYPEDLQKSIQEALTIEATDDTGKKLKLKGYVQYMEQFTEKMPSEIFDAFTLHMSRCARTYRSQSQRDQRKVILTQLFKSCDHTGVGLIDRHRVLNLFEYVLR